MGFWGGLWRRYDNEDDDWLLEGLLCKGQVWGQVQWEYGFDVVGGGLGLIDDDCVLSGCCTAVPFSW